MEPELVIVNTFNSRMEAELAASALEAYGIESLVTSDDCGGQRPAFQLAMGVQLMAKPEDAARAREVLNGPEAEG